MVSIYITTRNRGLLLKRAISSVINQTYQNLELIVVDDCSEEDIAPIIETFKSYAPFEVIYIRNTSPKGACSSRNTAIQTARGEYITGLDDDDEFLPNRIELLLKAYTESNTFSFISANDQFRNPDNSTRKSSRPTIVTDQMVLNSCENLVGNQVFASREKWLTTNGFDEAFPALQDFEAFFRFLVIFGPGCVLQQPLQIVYKNDNINRITSYKNQLMGITMFYLKYHHKMNLTQKNRFILRYRILKSLYQKKTSSKINLISILLFSNKHSLRRNIKFAITLIFNNKK